MDLKGKIIVITGGKGLLGSAMLKHIHAAGGTDICADIACKDDPEKREYRLDITDESSVHALINAVLKRHGRIDGWVNNAYPRSKGYGIPFEEQPHAEFLENLVSHLGGYALCSRLVLRQMRMQQSGSLVNMGSIYGCSAPDYRMYEGVKATPTPIVYTAIKGGVIQMTKALASLYGKYGVRVNAVSPGGIEDNQSKEFIERYMRKTLLGRMGTPEDVASAVIFLLSDGARYITGHNLLVDGGWTTV